MRNRVGKAVTGLAMGLGLAILLAAQQPALSQIALRDALAGLPAAGPDLDECRLDPRAFKACDRIIQANGTAKTERVRALVVRAELHRRIGHANLAFQDCSQAVALDSGNAEAFRIRGNALADLRKFEWALDDFDRAIRLDPKFVQAFSDRAAAFARMRNPRLAVRDYTEAIRLDPSRRQLFVDRAEAFMKVRRADLALDDITEAIHLDPTSADLYDKRGLIYARNNAYDRALADYNSAIRLSPNARFFLDRADANNLRGDWDRAIADYGEALRRDPRMAMAYNNRGIAWREKGDRKRALSDFEAALRVDPALDIAMEQRERLRSSLADATPPGSEASPRPEAAFDPETGPDFEAEAEAR
jgi:tetratricopeptide (TPR) repeat protein